MPNSLELAFKKGKINNMEIVNDSETSSLEDTNTNNSIEVIRRCAKRTSLNTSWEQSFVSFGDQNSENNTTPPFVSIIMTTDASPDEGSRSNSFTQTEATEPNHFNDINFTVNKQFKLAGTISDDNAHKSMCVSSKRHRRDSNEDNKENRPTKKTKCVESSTSVSDLSEMKSGSCFSSSSSVVSTGSEVSFKSVNSNNSYKTRKRRLKSDTNLFRDAIHRSRKNVKLGRHTSNSEHNTPGGSPRKERNQRRSNRRTKVWRIVDLCTWIGKKGYQSITGLYSDMLREPVNNTESCESNVAQDINDLRKYIEEVDKRHENLVRENEILNEQLKKMMAKIEELEGKLSCQMSQPVVQPCGPPPPPPPPPLPPPPPPPPLPSSSKPMTRSHTLPRCGSAPPRIAAPRLSITPEDIANVKLRRTKDNPVRAKPLPKDHPQPLVTQTMLETTRAKLGKARPVAASTPKQQLTELEKCLLQESSMTSLYRRRAVRGSFRSAEELRVRPYPASRCTHSPHSPRSPRSNSLSRVTPVSPLKFPILCSNKE